ncbi:MAG: PAS domain-containing protein [Ginsengibacter sp.]
MLVLSTDPFFTIADVNTAYLKASNRKEKDTTGKSMFEIFCESLGKENGGIGDMRKSLEKVNSLKIPDKIIVYTNESNVNKTGKREKLYYECENTPVVSETGEIECILHTCVDVTEKENALRHLKSNEKKLLAVQQIAKIGYWKLDLRTNKVYWSDQVYNIFGVDKDRSKLTYELFFQAIHPEDKEMFQRERSAVLQGEKNMDCEFRIVQPNGILKWIHEMGKLEKNEQGEPIVFEGTVQDITGRKLLKLSLEENNLR